MWLWKLTHCIFWGKTRFNWTTALDRFGPWEINPTHPFRDQPFSPKTSQPVRPWKWIVGRRCVSFPFEMTYVQGPMSVFREGNMYLWKIVGFNSNFSSLGACNRSNSTIDQWFQSCSMRLLPAYRRPWAGYQKEWKVLATCFSCPFLSGTNPLRASLAI